jgi:hypothetical protein
MFSVEYDHDLVEITVVDETSSHEDLKVLSYDDIVFIKQWDEKKQDYMEIIISPDMFNELINSMNSPEGTFLTR